MPTLKQRKLAEKIIENVKEGKDLNKKDLLVSAGYDVVTAEASPGRTIDQKGVKQALHEYGFSEEGAKAVVREIMYSPNVDPNARLRATDQVFKVEGSYAPEKSVSVNVNQQVMTDEDIEKLANELNALHQRASIGGNGEIASTVDQEVQN